MKTYVLVSVFAIGAVILFAHNLYSAIKTIEIEGF